MSLQNNGSNVNSQQKVPRLKSQLSEQLYYDLSPTKRPKKQNKQQEIKNTKHKLDDLIQQLNGKLLDHFQHKQQKLLEQYKQQLVKAQKELSQLKTNTNQQQIRNKMIQRKRQLQKQRHQLIEANMFFSNKCEVYKKKLTSLVQQGKQLQRQVVFLQGQLQTANKKRLMLMSQIQDTSRVSIAQKVKKNERQQPMNNIFKTKNQKQEMQMETPYGKTQNLRQQMKNQESTKIKASSQKKITKSMSIQNPNMMKNKRNLNFGHSQLPVINPNSNNNYTNSKIFEKTPIQELFEQAVQKVREKKKSKKAMPSIKGQQFTDYQKRMIMQEFLSNEKVKKKIYEIIFDQGNDTNKLNIDDKKVRITFDDVAI